MYEGSTNGGASRGERKAYASGAARMEILPPEPETLFPMSEHSTQPSFQPGPDTEAEPHKDGNAPRWRI